MPGVVCFAGAVVTPAEFQIALETRRKAKLKAATGRQLSRRRFAWQCISRIWRLPE